MIKWIVLRAALIALVAWQGWVAGDNWLPSGEISPLMLIGMGLYGIVVIPVVLWAQRLNPRNNPVWHFPSWGLNPLTLRDPLQFFHMVGFLFTAVGAGAAFRDWQQHLPLHLTHGVMPAFGLGMVAGSYIAALIFRDKLEPLDQKKPNA
jgi:hypothetical protein